MRLTNFSDYALRLLIFAATRPDELVTIAQVSKTYGFSKNHLMKITNTCVIDQACGLKHVLREALEAFYRSLAQVTLADLVANPRSLNVIFDRQAKRGEKSQLRKPILSVISKP